MITLKLRIKHLINTLLIFLAAVAFGLLFSSSVLAASHPFVDENGDGIDDFDQKSGQYTDAEARAKIYGVEFPIADLGSCNSYYECRNFCEDPVNGETCVNYGKSRGFYQDDPLVLEQDKILKEAKKRLGCDTYESCLNFCEIPANYDLCHSFAKSQKIIGGIVADPAKEEIISKAKEVLGCDNAQSCQAFCLQQDNIAKCKSFAEDVGLRGGEQQVGPGGCQSEGSCRSFCADPNNFPICRGFTEIAGGSFTGPGGCDSAEGCFKYCQDNPNDCGYKEGEGRGIAPIVYGNPLEMCNRTPNCAWASDRCVCGYYGETKETMQKAAEYAGYCSANPDQCRPGQSGIFEDTKMRGDFEDFCKQSPEKCKPPADEASQQSYGRYGGNYFGGGPSDPAAECSRYGCSWNGSSCQCSSATIRSYTPPAYTEQGTQSSGYPAPSYGPGSGSGGGYSGDPAADCSRAPGCSWNGSSCQCTNQGGGTTTYTPQSGSGYKAPSDYQRPSGYSGSGGTYPGAGSYSQPGNYTQPYSGSNTAPSSGSYSPPVSGPSSGNSGSAPSAPSSDSSGGGSAPSAPSGGSSGSAPSAPSGGDSGGSGGGGSPPSGGDSGGGGSMPSAPTVQGVNTARGFWQKFLDYLR